MKEKLSEYFDKVSVGIDKLSRNIYLKSITNGMIALLPATFIGSISILFLVIMNLIPALSGLTVITSVLTKIGTITIGALALYIVITIPFNLITFLGREQDRLPVVVISVLSFLILTPLDELSDGIGALPITWLGAQGIFTAIITSIVVCKLFAKIKTAGITIKMPDGVPPMVSQTFESLIPAIVIGLLFILVDIGFNLTAFGSFHQFIYSIIQIPLTNVAGSLGAFILISVVQQLLWFFGIHGTNVVLPLVAPLWIAMDAENIAAISAGLPVENILGFAFYTTVTFGGTILGLNLLMLRAKSKQYREIGKLALVPNIFCINEPLVFGMPLVLNFKLAFPFIFNSAISIGISYFLTNIGVVAMFSGTQPIFGLPVGVHAAIQGNLSIIILQLILNLIISPLLWYPWFRSLDKETAKLEESQSKEKKNLVKNRHLMKFLKFNLNY